MYIPPIFLSEDQCNYTALELDAKRRGLQPLTHQQVVEHTDQEGVLPGLFKPEYLVHLDKLSLISALIWKRV